MSSVSIVIPVKDCESTIEKSISSVINQTYQDFEIVLVDNGCKDKTVELARDIGKDKIKVFECKTPGIVPALNTGLSVSRVGGSAQSKAMKKMSGSLKIELAQYRELAAFAQFGSDDLDDVTKKQLSRGAIIVELLKQPQYKPVPLENQVCLLYLASEGLLDEIDVSDISKYEEAWNDHSSTVVAKNLQNIKETGDLKDDDMAEIKKAAIDFNKTFNA